MLQARVNKSNRCSLNWNSGQAWSIIAAIPFLHLAIVIRILRVAATVDVPARENKSYVQLLVRRVMPVGREITLRRNVEQSRGDEHGATVRQEAQERTNYWIRSAKATSWKRMID